MARRAASPGLRPAKRTPAKRATLSEALAARTAAVFRDPANGIIGRLSERARQQGKALIRRLDQIEHAVRGSADAPIVRLDLHRPGGD
ncbi:MAG TPA: hypothetical protein VGM07_18090 [Stellaceae bacterium]|jgi:hypothetical protein